MTEEKNVMEPVSDMEAYMNGSPWGGIAEAPQKDEEWYKTLNAFAVACLKEEGNSIRAMHMLM